MLDVAFDTVLRTARAIVAGGAPALAALDIAVALVTSGHIVLTKRDARAATLWVGLVWLAPFIGPGLYLLVGINRIRRRGALRRPPRPPALPPPKASSVPLPSLARTGDRVVQRPLLAGNAVSALETGDVAYPEMLAAIDGAERSVALGTYIFDADAAGQRFMDALARAHARGVAVRVLIDAVGARYAWPRSAPRALHARGVPVARFLPLRFPFGMPFMNMRDHRKVLVVDGRVAFTGGMNIRVGHVFSERPPHPVKDVHFRVAGPVVGQLLESFIEDWRFTTKESLAGPAWAVDAEPQGDVHARVITDGPDEDFERLRWMYIAAANAAQEHLRIVTPYFVPDQGLLGVLAAAALRGVAVDIVLPQRSNLRVVDWATRALLGQLLEHGCRVFLTPPPFDHTKLLIADDAYVLLGSGNWDARTTRLNFELDVECFDTAFARSVNTQLVQPRIQAATVLVGARLESAWLPVRLRNGVARLLSPYL